MYRPASFVISVVAALLWAVSLTTAIKITNKDFDVKNDELFELKWSGQGNERVNIELATYPGHSVVHELYSNVPGSSQRLTLSENHEAREYCFKVTDRESKDTDYSDGFFFDGQADPPPVQSTSTSSGIPTRSVIIISCIVVTVVVLCLICFWCVWKRKRERSRDRANAANAGASEAPMVQELAGSTPQPRVEAAGNPISEMEDTQRPMMAGGFGATAFGDDRHDGSWRSWLSRNGHDVTFRDMSEKGDIRPVYR